MEFNQLLRKYREKADITKTSLAEQLGVTVSYVIFLEQGKRPPPTHEKCLKIAEILSIKGPALEAFLAQAYEERTAKNAAFLPAGGNVFTATTKSAPSPLSPVPVVSWVKANRFSPAIDNFSPGHSDEWVYIEGGKKAMFALHVTGDCMMPEFLEGDIIVVDPTLEAQNGDYIVIKDNESQQATFKQLKKYGKKTILHPLNPRYEDLELDHNPRWVILGKVVCKIKKY